MLQNVLIVKLAKLYTVNLYVFLSALYMLQYVPIVIILVIVYLFKKKKKNEPYFGMGKKKKPKLCHNTPLSIFSLGKGRESLGLKTLHKKLSTSALSDLPPARNDLDKASMMHVKIAQKMYIFHKFCTFPVTEGNEI